jgi:2-methylaconitate cis-trans-isomerase PrpF
VSELNSDKAFMARLEKVRIAAGQRMGIHDAADRVIPKPVLIAPPARGGALAGRYFMPHLCHGAFAITGSVAVATAAVTPDTLPAMLVGSRPLPTDLRIEHPSGHLDVRLEKHADYAEPAAFVVRTARRLFEGHVLVKRSALTAGLAASAPHRERADEEAEEVV